MELTAAQIENGIAYQYTFLPRGAVLSSSFFQRLLSTATSRSSMTSNAGQATQSLTTVFGHVFVEFVTGFDALIMGLTGDFTQQSKFTLWEQASSDVRHKSDTV
jgi:hypothetical protein